jgi:exonuclease III
VGNHPVCSSGDDVGIRPVCSSGDDVGIRPVCSSGDYVGNRRVRSSGDDVDTHSFRSSGAADNSATSHPPTEEIFRELHDYRLKHCKQLIFGHLNINSLKNKFHEIHEILNNDYIDVFGLTETKLDESFTHSLFKVMNYTCHRLDRNIHGGGVMIYVKSSLPHRMRKDLSSVSSDVETIVIEVTLRHEKMFFVLVYKPPRVQNEYFIDCLSSILDKCLVECKSVYILGDINVNFQNLPDCFSCFMNAYSLKNLVCEPTCFKSINNPSIIDVIITNTPARIASHLNTCVGISDFHNLVCAATKMHAPKNLARKIMYRSYRKFNNDAFVRDLSYAPLDVCNVFDDVDDAMWAYDTLLNDVLNEHAPVKSKMLRRPQLPYMNGELRRAINVKAMLRRKFNKCKSIHTWSLFKHQRNHVTSLKRKSLIQYFNNRCNSSVNSKQFWNTVKPFFSDKGSGSGDKNDLVSKGFRSAYAAVMNKNTNIAVASAITSYGRLMLYNLFCEVLNRGGKVMYCDTDSVFFNADSKEGLRK